ncbi:D-lactate dehydrogenase [cytochrome], mitochondrial [Mycena venus]|uniref:D-lactate dehydrogenase (cytochrome) n=1 Tax=Mycena venus TaxID=2733690 RepID=A0A8H7CX83_9AGAR|nr:D-lactate dehydrogenase [cytochrome], mitochondrial [Mycena venus]
MSIFQRVGRTFRPWARSPYIYKRNFSGSSVLRRADDPQPELRSSFAQVQARRGVERQPAELPTPDWFRYSPWSDKYQGKLKTRVLIQSLFYAVFITVAADYLDSTVFPPASEEAPPKYASPAELRIAIQKLQQAFPEQGRVDTSSDTLKTTGSSENSYHPASPHSVVVRPKSTEDVVKTVNIAREYKVPITAYSGATSLEGHFSGYPSGSICLDMSGMDQILHINEADSDMICQAGTRWEDINQTLKEKGIPLFFPLDPGPGATIGGMVGTGCSGTNATVVLPNGEVIKTRRRARKSSAGFDATKLFIGAEVDAISLKLTCPSVLMDFRALLVLLQKQHCVSLQVLPTKVAMAQFPDVEHAVSAVQEILNTPYGPHVQCVELLDDHMMDAINKGGVVDRPYPVKDTLFFKIQGDDAAIKLTSKTIQALVKKHGSSKFEFASTDEEAETLWQNRKYALMSTMAAHPESRCWTTDVCVPVSRLPQLVLETKRDLANAGLNKLEAVSEAVHRLVHRALALDGTCTGEHGVGVGKKEYLPQELGQGTVDLMKRVKKAVDPYNIMNPGKLYPD